MKLDFDHYMRYMCIGWFLAFMRLFLAFAGWFSLAVLPAGYERGFENFRIGFSLKTLVIPASMPSHVKNKKKLTAALARRKEQMLQSYVATPALVTTQQVVEETRSHTIRWTMPVERRWRQVRRLRL
jgi:hypothetical protein